jgi:mono/diheme cytochrome c family protein
MPAYPSLFDGGADRPKQAARDLVAYLESLGRAREVAAPEGEARAMAGCNCADDEMLSMAFHSPAINTNAGKARRAGTAPALNPAGDAARGRTLYARYCAACHGEGGQNDRSALSPAPANLAEHQYSLERLSFVLENGIAGTAMPAWRELPPDDRAALAAAVRGLYSAQPEPNIPQATLDLGAQVYKANCAQCHGDNGRGDGSAVGELRIVPADLGGVRPTVARSLRVLREGIEGTQMAPWTSRLGEAELSAVAYYIRGFYRGDAR